MTSTGLHAIDLGVAAYGPAIDAQHVHHAAVLAARDAGTPEVGRLLLVEHSPPVITISRRPDARRHLVATSGQLARAGVEVRETDRGGDITYHGPGQLVAYPILDLNTFGLNLHAYMRLLEDVVIDTLRAFNIEGQREPGATGVWVRPDAESEESSTKARVSLGTDAAHHRASAPKKICAMGVRIRRWVTMHGLALNITTNLDHFDLIIPCGIPGRSVTSMARQLGDTCPTMDQVKRELVSVFGRRIEAILTAETQRAQRRN